METTPTAPEQHEISVSEKVTGSVQFLTPAALSNPAPARFILICDVIRNCGLSLIPMVAAAPIFTASQSNTINFCLGIVCVLCEAVKKGTGVKPTTT